MLQVRLGEEGWRERYYSEKFGAKTEEEREEIRKDVVSVASLEHVLHLQTVTPAVQSGV